MAKGFHFDRRTKYRHAVQTVERALHYAFINRRKFKRDMRKLWIVRINAATRMFDMSYSKFIGALKKNGVEINRKMLAELQQEISTVLKLLLILLNKKFQNN